MGSPWKSLCSRHYSNCHRLPGSLAKWLLCWTNETTVCKKKIAITKRHLLRPAFGTHWMKIKGLLFKGFKKVAQSLLNAFLWIWCTSRLLSWSSLDAPSGSVTENRWGAGEGGMKGARPLTTNATDLVSWWVTFSIDVDTRARKCVQKDLRWEWIENCKLDVRIGVECSSQDLTHVTPLTNDLNAEKPLFTSRNCSEVSFAETPYSALKAACLYGYIISSLTFV